MAAAAAPVFYTIASLYYPGYNLTQRGSQIVAEAEDIDNPFQLWYKDDSWRYVEDGAGNPAFALINNGSKAALKADDSAASNVSLFNNYKHSEDTTHTTLWTLRSSSTLYSVALKVPLLLGIGKSPPESGDGVAGVLGFSNSATAGGWNLKAYAPPAFIIQSAWVSQILVAKPPHTDVTFTSGAGSFNNELGVVAVHQNNQNGEQEVWYRVPAASPLEDSNSSFFVISKLNGKALKGSTKSGDKRIVCSLPDKTLFPSTLQIAIASYIGFSHSIVSTKMQLITTLLPYARLLELLREINGISSPLPALE